ncbi:hypothetical protein VF06_16110 [Nostoc linckia z4]|nr:hypothetical protein VF02_14030 [Nostoc linckia z1]PHJ69478.1 hypothetical protein VF05_13665 [Nostoc linckia z3]PHJ74761.1 hypothetical protein VF03_13110 [Nostoc linckia z2]PHJ82486.1 hypothetical protein VF06_16110 [Nostoc linckia z4]PHJ88560.1 hypothetical protein VF07_15890 [Nostoc linckia z6]PHK34136.1 hypothetical protein VF12_24230 [Nostoc linckia z15]PHK47207.1 hypothetical protein VF13_06760 [Nostoc linckia z16]
MGKGKRLKGKGKIPNLLQKCKKHFYGKRENTKPFLLPLFTTSLRSLMITYYFSRGASGDRQLQLWKFPINFNFSVAPA